MPVNKTLYVKDEDVAIWETARELVGDKLSSFLTSYLREYVQRETATAEGFQRITLHFREGGGLPRAIAFHGRWLIEPDECFEAKGRFVPPPRFAVAVTPKSKIVIFEFHRLPDEDGFFNWGRFDVYDNFEFANQQEPSDVLAEAMKRLGIRVQELDI